MSTSERKELVSVPRRDLESLEATIATLQHEGVMDQLRASEHDIRAGRTRDMENLLEEL